MNSPHKQKWFHKLLRRRLFFCLLILLQLLAFLYFIISRSLASNILSGILRLTSLVVVLHIISRRDKEAYKLTWVFFIMIFPVFGAGPALYKLYHTFGFAQTPLILLSNLNVLCNLMMYAFSMKQSVTILIN